MRAAAVDAAGVPAGAGHDARVSITCGARAHRTVSDRWWLEPLRCSARLGLRCSRTTLGWSRRAGDDEHSDEARACLHRRALGSVAATYGVRFDFYASTNAVFRATILQPKTTGCPGER
jgi:hypothetical protein